MARRSKGEGSIYQRSDGRWQGRVVIGKDEQGKTKYQFFYGKTKAEVTKAVKEAVGKVEKGIDINAGKTTFTEWFEIWLASKKNNIKPSTYDTYETFWRVHIKSALGHMKLDKIQPHHVQKLLDEKQGGELSPRSVRYIHTTINTALKSALKQRIISFNPADAELLELPKNTKIKEVKPLTQDDVKAFIATAKEDKFSVAYILSLALGMRKGEVLGLQWENIDFEQKTLTIKNNLTRVKGKGLVLTTPKTASSNRVVLLPEKILTLLSEHGRKQAVEREIAKASGKYSEAEGFDNMVFTYEEGKPVCPRYFERKFKKVLEKAGLSQAGLHSLRHSYGTLQNEAGVNMKAIQATLGHSKASFTMSVYTQNTTELQREATQAVDKWLPL
ncbi:integrase family protein [Dethiobacter alkaliphilus AHT 1]|uniref:Integrase family protein n=2 Tax=Dethiobacter TaxID=427925 RepID=C0GET2_DETAL|nr:integrase family protein [Dethiobacter alkaliphilus AHT 1]